jgi:hypothetical protein
MVAQKGRGFPQRLRSPVTCHEPRREPSDSPHLSLGKWPLPILSSHFPHFSHRRAACLVSPCAQPFPHFISRVTWSILDCAHRASTLKWSLQACQPSPLEGGLFDLPLRAFNEGLLRPRVTRAQETNRLSSRTPSELSDLLSTGWLGRSSSARVERAPSERARSASKRTTRPPCLPFYSSNLFTPAFI